ncbi:lipopolysaccharide biosynthesis protein [Cellulosilyticum ruminicola]|uniref:lipopolysaccharide biosynthesis protein n=1 Tax=Cellulosilyticum ruminicola TaxID=425254 RepID=UPI0006D25BA4|nr:hypothetical protein [Cellulosilyticum ruminicola]
MRTRNAIYNTFSATTVQILTFFIGIILPRMLLVTYGSELNGLRASINQFISYLYILEMGLGGALTYALYKPLQSANIDEINGVVAAARKSYRQIGYMFTALIGVLAIVYPLVINKGSVDTLTIILLVLVIGITGIINYFTIGGYTVLLTAAQHGYILSIIKCIYLVFNTVLLIVLIKFKCNIVFVYTCSISSTVLHALLIRLYIKKHYSYLNLKVPPQKNALKKRYDVLIHQISGLVVSNVPMVLLTLYGDLKEVSVYSIYALIFSSITMILGVISTALTPAFGDLIAEDNKSLLKQTYSQYEFIYYVIITIIYSCTYILGLGFVKIYTDGVTDAQYINPNLLLLFSLIGFLTSWKVPQVTMITAAGHFKETRHRAIIEASITIIMSCILGKLLGLEGIMLGSIMGLCYRAIDMYYARKITGFSFKNTFMRVIRMLCIITIINAPFILWIKLDPSNWFEWLIVALGVGIWSVIVACSINTIFEKQTMQSFILRLLRLLNIKINHKLTA